MVSAVSSAYSVIYGIKLKRLKLKKNSIQSSLMTPEHKPSQVSRWSISDKALDRWCALLGLLTMYRPVRKSTPLHSTSFPLWSIPLAVWPVHCFELNIRSYRKLSTHLNTASYKEMLLMSKMLLILEINDVIFAPNIYF